MKTQKQCLALHLGEWHGLFSDYRPTADGWELSGQKRSRITFETLDSPSAAESSGAASGIRQTNTYYPLQGSPTLGNSHSWVYQDFSAGLRFFSEGSFSNGRVQLAPFSDFAVEQGFLWGDRKARVVQQWDAQGRLVEVTTILEERGQMLDPAGVSPPISKEQLRERLQGQWRGIAQSFAAGDYHPSEREVCFSGAEWMSDWDPLPGGLWIAGPDPLPMPTTHGDRSFSVSLSWFPRPEDGRQGLRLIRDYDARGAWQRVTLIRAEKHRG
ncbi:MAG: DUF3598 family protein [Thermostichus sp. HHBFW_bins_43]